jgi:hypothetical protein
VSTPLVAQGGVDLVESANPFFQYLRGKRFYPYQPVAGQGGNARATSLKYAPQMDTEVRLAQMEGWLLENGPINPEGGQTFPNIVDLERYFGSNPGAIAQMNVQYKNALQIYRLVRNEMARLGGAGVNYGQINEVRNLMAGFFHFGYHPARFLSGRLLKATMITKHPNLQIDSRSPFLYNIIRNFEVCPIVKTKADSMTSPAPVEEGPLTSSADKEGFTQGADDKISRGYAGYSIL